MTVLDTPRLILRPWTEADAEELYPVFSDPVAMRYWNAPPSPSVEAVREDICRSVDASPAIHAGWAAVLKATGQPVGFVNYHHRDVRNRRVEIGYILARPLWRTGLMREAVSTLLDHCFGTLDVHRAEATVSPANDASAQFLESLGFSLEGGPMRDRMWTSDGRALDALMFGLLAPDWRSHHPSRIASRAK